MITTHRTIAISEHGTDYNGRWLADPLDSATVRAGLGRLLNLLPATRGEIVIILDGKIPGWWGLPQQAPGNVVKDAATEHPFLWDLRQAGWTVDRLTTFTTARHPQHADVHITVHDWLTQDGGETCPLVGSDARETSHNLTLWHEATGVAWRGTGGVAGTSFLRSHGMVARPDGRDPRWKLPEGDVDRGWHNAELATIPKLYTRAREGRYAYTFDARKAYLAAWQSALFARTQLRPGPREFDKKLSGWWFVELEPWAHPDLPDPAGYLAHGRTAKTRWLTTPTLQLIDQLTRDDRTPHGGYRILESRVAPGTQLLRPAATRLREIIMDPTSRPPLIDAAKHVYTKAGGMMASPRGLIYRPDWFATIKAHARLVQWLKVAAVARDGWFPATIDTDAITYHGHDAAIPADLARHFPQGDALGTWRYYDVRETE